MRSGWLAGAAVATLAAGVRGCVRQYRHGRATMGTSHQEPTSMNVSPHHQRPAKYPWPGGSPIGTAVVLALAVVVIVGFVLISGLANEDEESNQQDGKARAGASMPADSQPHTGVRSPAISKPRLLTGLLGDSVR